MKKKKILLYGIGTFKNKGVEAIIQSTVKQIKSKDYEISAASHDINYNQNFYNKEIKKYIKHYKKSDELTEKEKELEQKYQNMLFDYNNFELLYQNEVVEEMKNSDICISVGGDNYCYDFCTWLYALDKKSHDLGKKTVLWGVSLFEKITDTELINNLFNYDVLVIRESLTYNAVKKFIPEEKILFRPDPAFSLEKKEIQLNKWYKNRNFVILNFSPLTVEDELKYNEIKNLINYIIKETKYSICLLPHVTTEDCNDLDILKKLKDELKKEQRIYLEEGIYNCNELKYIISKATILVAARTHASIAAYSMNVPTLVIGYSVKSRGIAQDIFGNYDDYVISKDELKNNKLIEKFKFIDKNKDEIKKVLTKKMPNYKEQAKNIWKDLIKKLDELEKKTICSREKCIGCGICAKKCPKDAITMEEDMNGFIYPKLDLKKCINCNLCRKECPINNKKKSSKKENKYYAAKSKDEKTKIKSSSGGIFAVLSEVVLENKGIVYGCQMKDFHANHIRIDKKKDIEKILGSKYIQSNIIDIFDAVKKDLIKNKQVLFSGTPCQIGALKKYLNEEYNNLITVSVICHGVTNEEILDIQIKELEKNNQDKVNNINFRTKENGWTKSSIKYEFTNKKITNKFIEDDFMYLYLNDTITRESCFDCKFKGNNNEADIILGDYWGIEITNREFYDEKGISAIIINSSKGEKFFLDNKIFENIEYCEGNYDDIVKYNPSLIKSLKISNERNWILSEIKESGIEKVSLRYRIKKMQQELEKSHELNQSLHEENQIISNEIYNIKNSKRWKITDKIFNNINKFKRRK